MVTDKKIAKQLNFSRIFLFFTTLNNMYVEGISLGYMKMEILLGLREMKLWGDECAAFTSLESV